MTWDDLPSRGTSPEPERAAVEICVFTPSPLYEVAIEESVDGAAEVHFHAAGQGPWVARMATRLGARVTLCAPFGGEPGDVLKTLLETEGVHVQAIVSRGWNGGYIQDRRTEERASLADVASPRLTRHEADELYNAMLGCALASRSVVLTGPAVEGVLPTETYRRLASDLGANGVNVIADLSGDELRALEGGVCCLKVAHDELIEAGFAEDETAKSLVEGAERARAACGARMVVVSRAAEPTLALVDDRLLEIEAPRFETLEHRGAGDSMTAGLTVGWAQGLEPEAILRLATAAGALNVTRHGLGSGRRQTIEKIAELVAIRPVDRFGTRREP